MRVLHVLPNFTAAEGLARSVRELAARVDASSHLVTNRITASAPEFDSVHALGGHKALFAFTRPSGLRAALEAVYPDVVHVHGGVLASALALSPSFEDVPVVVSVHTWLSPPTPLEMAEFGLLVRRGSSVPVLRAIGAAAFGDRLSRLASSGRVRGFLTPDPVIFHRLSTVATCPVRYAPGAAAVDELRAMPPGGAPIIGFAGRAESVRGIDVLIDAFALVRAAVPAARLRLFLLPTPHVSHLRARAAAAGFSSDAFEVTTVPLADLRTALATCHVVAFPFKVTATITPPLAAAEAMSVGVPVVASRVGCLTPLVRPGDNGFLVEPGSVGPLASAILRALDHHAWCRLSAGARATIAGTWNWDRAATAAMSLYDEVTGDRARTEAASVARAVTY